MNEYLEVYLKIRLEGHNFYYKECMTNTKCVMLLRHLDGFKELSFEGVGKSKLLTRYFGEKKIELCEMKRCHLEDVAFFNQW